MASRPDQLRLTPDERADLVAYVDGELPEAHARIDRNQANQECNGSS